MSDTFNEALDSSVDNLKDFLDDNLVDSATKQKVMIMADRLAHLSKEVVAKYGIKGLNDGDAQMAEPDPDPQDPAGEAASVERHPSFYDDAATDAPA